jgi:hypothetical protein
MKSAEPAHLELYHRFSRLLRVGRRAIDDSWHRRFGREEGLAARLQARAGGGVGFAAASGGGDRSIHKVIDRASRARPARVANDAQWSPISGGTVSDLDPPEEYPDAAALEDWLERAWNALVASKAVRASTESVPLWVEVAQTVETWATDRGLRASRSRTRVWALVRPPSSPGQPAGRPGVIARRGWREFPESGWAELLGDRLVGTGPIEPAMAGSTKLLFNPESSARLVSSLVRGVHTDESLLGAPVGPGWRLVDDPNDLDALFGGSFDDAGFRTRRRTLADGRNLVGLVEGQGNYRRPSFRDPPVPCPTQIVVEADRTSPPDGGMLVSDVEIHPMGPADWIIEIRGAPLRDGRPVAPLRHGFVRIEPAVLLERCLAAVGTSRSSHRGVRTPALLFDDLPIRSSRIPGKTRR